MSAMPITLRLARGTSSVPDGELHLLAEGDALLRARRWRDATVAFHRLAAQVPQERRYRARMHYARGREHAEAGRTAMARAELERAIRLDPDLDDAALQLARLPVPLTSGWRRLFSRD